MSDMDVQQKMAEMIKEREEDSAERVREREKHPRCAILPSPEKLDKSIGSPGSDKTDTLGDFDLIKGWVTTSALLNTEFYQWNGTDGENLEDVVYYPFIQQSFSAAFDAIGHFRNVRGLGKSMVVFRLFEKLKYSNERSTIF